MELSIEGLELGYRLLDTIFAFMVGTIYETAPHHDATVGL